MPIEMIVAMAIAVVALISGLIRSYHAIADAQERVGKVGKAKFTQIDRIRKAARASLSLKRSIKDGKRRLEGSILGVEEAELRLKAAEAIDHQVYVLDDRRTKADQVWSAVVVHPGYAQSINHNVVPEAVASWAKGRRFMVFALDIGKAREKLMVRFPERLGYRVESVVEQVIKKSKL